MTSIFILFVKTLRYLVPFIAEMLRNDEDTDTDDLNKKYLLKRFFFQMVFRFILILIIVFFVFNNVIPLYTENIALKRELKDFKVEYDKQLAFASNAQKNATEFRTRLTVSEEEEKRLTKRLVELTKENAVLRSHCQLPATETSSTKARLSSDKKNTNTKNTNNHLSVKVKERLSNIN